MECCYAFILIYSKSAVFVTTNVKHVYVLNIILYHTKYCSTNCITEFQYHAISLYIDKKRRKCDSNTDTILTIL